MLQAGECDKLHERINKEILINEKHKEVIKDLEEKVKKSEEGNQSNLPKASSGCEHIVEIKKMKDMIEKAKELKNTDDLKIKKLKEQHLEEINEVKIRNIEHCSKRETAVKII